LTLNRRGGIGRPDLKGVHMKIGSYAKAIVAAIVAGSGSLSLALDDGVVTAGEGLAVALAVLGALGITAAVPNASRSDQFRG
jgi:hypothetical protein